MTVRLKKAIEAWFAEKEASPFAIPAEHQVERVRRPRFEEGCVSPDQASHHLQRTLSGTKWEKIRGWRIYRHSFISNCASCSVDQRMIANRKRRKRHDACSAVYQRVHHALTANDQRNLITFEFYRRDGFALRRIILVLSAAFVATTY